MRRFHLGLGALCVGLTVVGVACSSSSGGGNGEPDAAVVPDGSTQLDGSPVDGTAEDGGPLQGDGGPSTTPDGGTLGAPKGTPGPNIVVDQFGYRTPAEKIAVVRSPRLGFDVLDPAFAAGAKYALVNTQSSAKVYEAAPVPWNSGAVDHSSGDVVWRFDFSSVVAPGSYFVQDETNGTKSATFRIGDDVYKDTLVQATRMLYYQRDGVAKTVAFAGSDWTDGVGHPQNATCALVDGGSVKDVHGGWYEAGDQNKFTNGAAGNVIELLRAYAESPSAFGDATNIPESGNGVPDVLDEAKWGLDWLARMQNSDGSVLSIVGNDGASPPSSDTTPCKYGPASTSATWTSAAAFAYAATVFKSVGAVATAYPGYADGLAAHAASAWTWASANPSVVFQNLPAGLGTREYEVNDASRVNKSVEAAVYLFELTGTASYQTFVDANYTQLPTTLDPLNVEPVEALLEYTKTAAATSSVVSAITGSLATSATGFANFQAEQADTDPFLAYLPTYTQNSNRAKVGQGNLFYDVGGATPSADAGAVIPSSARYAERYVHYIHGLNPLGLVYLSNMNAHGATRSVTQFFDRWFFPGTRWSTVTLTQPGPPPGFLTAGPDNLYTWEPCCPNNCGAPGLCGATIPSPPTSQPDQKSYLDFNASYPLDSWQVTEAYDAAETQYIRLLSKFAR